MSAAAAAAARVGGHAAAESTFIMLGRRRCLPAPPDRGGQPYARIPFNYFTVPLSFGLGECDGWLVFYSYVYLVMGQPLFQQGGGGRG